MRTLKVGENAPHFTLLNQNNEAVSLIARKNWHNLLRKKN